MATIEELIKTKPIKDPYKRCFTNIMYNGSWFLNKITQVLKPFDITEPQFNVLRILRGAHGEAMNLYEVQNRMVQKMSNVSRLVDKLEEKGFVSRKECKDNRRRVDLCISKKGLELLEEIETPLQKIFKSMSINLTKSEAEMLSMLLDKIRYE
jgi:DNA-binding MarR family transcriptional regulator